MVNPLVIIQTAETDRFSRAIIAPADRVLRETGWCHLPVETLIKVEMDRGCLVTCHTA
jgi:hypothetical protein